MALTPTYARTSLQVPLPQVPTAALNIVAGVPTTFSALAAGGTTDLSAFNKDAVRGDLLGRYGGGAIAVLNGLDLTQGVGLAASITPGQAMVDGPVPETLAVANYAPALQDNSFNFTWMSAAGAINKNVAAADGTPPAAPDAVTLWCYLGGYSVAGGQQVVIDYSGRFSMLGGIPYVRTADLGAPLWAPPSTTRFLHRTLGGLYLWDGSAYATVDVGTAALLATSMATVSDQQAQLDDLGRKLRALLAQLAQYAPDFIPASLSDDLSRGFSERN